MKSWQPNEGVAACGEPHFIDWETETLIGTLPEVGLKLGPSLQQLPLTQEGLSGPRGVFGNGVLEARWQEAWFLGVSPVDSLEPVCLA